MGAGDNLGLLQQAANASNFQRKSVGFAHPSGQAKLRNVSLKGKKRIQYSDRETLESQIRREFELKYFGRAGPN
jgi:hypothetical protein